LNYHPTPLLELHHPVISKAGVNVIVKREDLNHPLVSGNKWWKLKYNLIAAAETAHKTILTFGGAFSNHIYATAAASREAGFKSIGLIRGERTLPLNPILEFATLQGMQIHYLAREAFRLKATDPFIQKLRDQFGEFFLIPEGGSNVLAVKGCAEFAETELKQIHCDHILLPVGTGGTMAGLICGLKGEKNIIGISVLKGGSFLKAVVENLIHDFSGNRYPNWSLLTEYHHGGYAKVTPQFLNFIDEMKKLNDLPLDPVYTGKLLWGAIKEIESGSFKRGSTILLLHTGSAQNAIR
jgi:1-aminocyclopropane-1-carboxylate deaminase/D-cysteine desulfhydrase-like pyridoxal-dependent ACC family enzyme